MPRTQQAFTDLSRGEVSPKVWGRFLSEQYPTMLELAENVIVERRGGVFRRYGTNFVHETKFPGLPVRLVPFVFSDQESYMMEFGDFYVRLFRNNGYVEDIGNIQGYLGDGTSESFVFPYPGVAQGDIEVLDSNGDVIPASEYTVSVIDTNNNYMPPFSDDGAWLLNAGQSPAPVGWVRNLAEVTSPAAVTDEEDAPVLKLPDIQLPIGGSYLWQVDVASATYDETTQEDSNTSDIPLVSGAGYISVASFTAAEDVLGTLDIEFQFHAQDTESVQTSDFLWEVRRNEEILLEDTALLVGSPGTTITDSVSIENIYAGDVFSLQVRATGNHINSSPIVAGSSAQTYIRTSYEFNQNARLRSAVGHLTNIPSKTIDRNPDVGTLNIADTDEPTYRPAPINIFHQAEPGVSITLTNPSLKFKVGGYVITFNTPPADGDWLAIRDGSIDLPDAEVKAAQDGLIYEFASPFAAEELQELYWAQQNDVMYFCHPDHRPWKLSRHGAYDWRWSQPHLNGVPWEQIWQEYESTGDEVATQPDPSLNPPEYPGVEDDPPEQWYTFPYSSVENANVRVELANGTLIPKADYWIYPKSDTAGLDGPTEKIKRWMIAFKTGKSPAAGVKFIIRDNGWEYNANLNGYPRCVVFFQERLVFAATREHPQRVWMSRQADYEYFHIPAGDSNEPYLPDDAVEYTIASHTHEAINWLSSERVLLIGTTSTEHRFAPDEYIASDRLPQVSKMSDFGGAHQMPVYAGELTCFFQYTNRQFRSFEQRYDTFVELYQSIDLSWMQEHMLETKVKEGWFALVPDAIGGMVTQDGTLLIFTYDPTINAGGGEKSIGWTRQVTDGKFVSCQSMPTFFYDQIWVAVEREVSGETKTYIEFLYPDTWMDSSLVWPPIDDENVYLPQDTFANLDHLEDKEVHILTDQGVHRPLTVAGGQVVLDYRVNWCRIGLPYTHAIRTLPFHGGNPSGTAMGKQQRWPQIWCRIVGSTNPIINGARPKSRSPSTPHNTMEDLKTKDVRVHDLKLNRNGQIEIGDDLPLPSLIAAIYGDFMVGQG